MPRFFEVPAVANEFFPAHGWIAGPTGVPCLRLPVQRLYQVGEPVHDRFSKNNIAGIWLQTHSPTRTLHHLAVCLRDIHKEVREILPLQEIWETPVSTARDDALNRLQEGLDRLAILLIAGFTLLRRLADEVLDASRPLLFEHWHSAPRQMKVAKAQAAQEKLRDLKPICDVDVLTDALKNYTKWFEQLGQDDGLRDIVHKPHVLQISPQGTSSPGQDGVDWRIVAHLVRDQPKPGGGLSVIDLFPELLRCVDGACVFMSRFVEAVGSLRGYEQGDFVFLTGNVNDTIGCWPPIIGSRTRFPLTD
jgi:hypothetical protein